MRKSKIAVIVICLIVCLGACQKTPDELAVVGKNDGRLESAVQETDNTNQLEGWVDRWQNSFQGADARISVVVDASVIVPDIEQVAMYRVKPHEISVEEAKAWGDILFQGCPAYEQLGTMTKEEISEKILYLKSLVGEGGTLEEEYKNAPEDLDAIRAQLEEELEFYESKYASAPEGYEREPAEWVFHPQSYYDFEAELDADNEEALNLNKSLCMKFDVTVGQNPYFFSVMNRDEEDFKIHSLFWATDDRRVYQTTPLSVPNLELEEKANQILKDVGLEDKWILKECIVYNTEVDYEIALKADPDNEELRKKAENPEAQYWYELTFVPVYGGMEVTKQQQLETVKSKDSYASNYYYESLTMKYSNDQFIEVYWNSPMETVEIVNPNIPLLSWDEITERFQIQSQNQYSSGYLQGDGDSNFIEAEVRVKEIELGLARIRIKDSDEEYYYVPAWTFKGNTAMNFGSGKVEMEDYMVNLMTINAIDGTVINTALGY